MRDVEHLQNLLKRHRHAFKQKYCLHPKAPQGCSSVSAAHTVQRAMLEQFIARNGHVMQFKVTPQVNPAGLLVAPEEVGIKKATTFFGFCNCHDNALFRPLEAKAFCSSRQQIALLGFRAICRDLYGKEAEIESMVAIRDYCAVCPDIAGFEEKDARHKMLQLARVNARTNLVLAKDQFAAMLTDDRQLRYYVIEFDKPPVYFCSVAFLPEWDFEGGRLQDLRSISLFRPICFSAWATAGRATAVFCWHKSADKICVPFVDSLRRIEPARIASRILSMTFEVSENIAFSATWWESMRKADRRLLAARVMSGGTFEDRRNNCLVEDGQSALSSSIVAEHTFYGSAVTDS